MTSDELRARVERFVVEECKGRWPAVSLIESLCREMIAEGLERATEGLKVSNEKLVWALKELGPTDLRCEAYVKAAVEQVIWARAEAQRVKEGI